ncbi:hypothetical protein ASG43_00040 [Aureimonas sp. Leaf454]|uniref:hypothetical protein n=1 Tax=Aureimonas sp. Leaf454 TaxID=1736381 RepID=UPI0007017269|nr:hypothetical protein [Aureimonas sp. Leaf454]KQT54071.1 hypothetical protein ASG43_00040 [Aureimonas sp. Leaf454]
MGDGAVVGSKLATGGEEAPGGFLGLSGEESRLVEDLCSDLLKTSGVDGTSFFARLRAGHDIDTALGLPSHLREFMYARAHRWFSVGRVDKAEQLFRALCAADPRDADYWVGFGICLRKRGDLVFARLAFETAIAHRPTWDVPHLHAVEVAIRRGDRAGAQDHAAKFRQAAGENTPPELLAELARLDVAMNTMSSDTPVAR